MTVRTQAHRVNHPLRKRAAALLTALLLLALASVVSAAEPAWRLDEGADVTEPRNFRISSDDWHVEPEDEVPSRDGLQSLHASGSAQLNEKSIASLFSILSAVAPDASRIYMVDLRQESHGFADGLAVSWYTKKNQGNAGKSDEEAAADETERLGNLLGREITFLPKGKTDKKRIGAITFAPQRVQTEKELAEAAGFRYARFYVTDKTWPEPETVDAFLDFVSSLPENAWLHFHCRAGHGRTTSFLAIYDMLKNPGVSSDDVLERQYLLGGTDLTVVNGNEWEAERKAYRLEMLRLFPLFVSERREKGPSLSWSAWLAELEATEEE